MVGKQAMQARRCEVISPLLSSQ